MFSTVRRKHLVRLFKFEIVGPNAKFPQNVKQNNCSQTTIFTMKTPFVSNAVLKYFVSFKLSSSGMLYVAVCCMTLYYLCGGMWCIYVK